MNTKKLLQSVKNLQNKEEIVQWLYKNLTPTDAYDTIAELVLNYPQEQPEQDNRVTINEDVYNQIKIAINNAFNVIGMDNRGRISDYVKFGYIGAMRKILGNRQGITNSQINLKLKLLYEREKRQRTFNGEDISNFKPTLVDRRGNIINLPEELQKLADEEKKELPFEIVE